MKIPMVPVIALAAGIFAAYHVLHSQTPLEQHAPPVEPARSPYQDKVAGAGVVESRSENIEIAAEVSGIVTGLLVGEGDHIMEGQLLAELDVRDMQAEMKIRQAILKSAEAELSRLQAMPRPEEIPPLEAEVLSAQAYLEQTEDIFQRQTQLTRQGVTTQEELVIAKANREVARAELIKAEADLALMKAGAWQQDLLIRQAEVERMRVEVDKIQTELERHELRAPQNFMTQDDPAGTTWEVLQINIRPGEFISAPPVEPALILGDLGPRRIRVDIDEYDLPRFRPTGKAVAYARGDGQNAYPLKFVRVDPYVIPKRSLTGDNADRVDTRVLQVIYEFESNPAQIYVGQQMDVFIETASDEDDAK